jgi:hypothetical protein
MRPTDRQLHQYLARALEPPAEEQVRRWLSCSPPLQARLEALSRAHLRDEGPSWSLPPPGVPGGLQGVVQTAAVMDRSGGGWLELWLDIPEGHQHDAIVVLERGSDWVVTFPAERDEDILASMLELDAAGRRKLNVVPAPGSARLAVVLCPPELAARRDWAELRERLVAGALPAATVALPG